MPFPFLLKTKQYKKGCRSATLFSYFSMGYIVRYSLVFSIISLNIFFA